MANTNQGINLPITAQLTNLKQIATQLKQFSDINILGNSFSSKTINSELSKVMRALEALELRSKNAFKTEADFSAVEKEANKIENSLDNVKKTITSIPFKDLKIPEDAAKQIQELETKINGLNAGFKDFKKLQKEGLVGNTQFTTDLAKAFGTNAASKMLDKEYDELYKSIKNGLTRVNNELEIQKNIFAQNSQIVQQNTTGKADQSVLNALDWLSKGFANLPKNPDKYNEQQQMLSKYFNFNEDKTAFTSFKRGNFADNFYKELAEKFQIDPTQMEEIRKRVRDSAQAVKKTVSQEFQDIVSNKDRGAQIFSGRNIDYTGLVASAAEYRSQIKTRDTSSAAVDNTAAKLNAAQAAYNAFMQTQNLVNQKQTELANALKEPVSSLESLRQAIYNNVQAAPQLGAAYDEAATRLNQLRATAEAGRAKLQQLDSAMGKLTGFSNFVNRYIGLYAIMRKVTQAIRNAFNNIKELDKTITNIAVVTNMTQADLWSKIGEYTSMAQQFGVATNDVYTVSQIFYQQGLQTAQVMSLTTETLKMAKIAGLEYGEAADAMTVAVRAFKIEMTEAQQVTDTYSALAAKFAVSSAEIANAMEKTASSAANVGMSIQSTSAFISVMVQTTRESAENIGSALKSIISRYGEMKASPSKLLNIDGEEVAFNKVDTALASVGISIKDAAGQFRNFDDVIMELAQKWDTLDNNTQRYIATIMAGNRQQSRFIALVSNYDELSRAISTANNAENASIVQVAKTMDSLETKAQQVKNAFSQIYLDLHIENGLKDMYDWLTRVLKTIGKLGMKNGALPTLANLIGFGTGTKSLINMAKNKINEYKSKINLNTEEAEQKYKDLEQKLREPIDKKLNLIVDDTQIKTIQANIQSAATTAGTSAASALVNATPNAGHNTQFYLAAMARWQSEGKLQTPGQRASFMNQYSIDSSSEQGQQINALLEQFSTLTGQAQQLGTALIDASNASNNAARADDEEARSSQQAGQNDEQETASSKQVTLADVSKARAAEEAARALAALARIDAQEAADKAQRASNNAASNREELQEAANVAKAKAEEAAEAVKVAQADREKTSAAFQAQQADTNKAQEGNNVIQTEKAKESANIVVTQTEYDESNANKDSAQSERDKANANRTSSNIKGGSWEGHQTAMKVTGVLTGLSRIAGTALAAWGASQTVKSTDANESNKIWTGIGNGISGAGTGASMGMAFGPWGAAIGAIGGFLVGGLGAIIDGANYTLAERIENAKQEAEAANDEALKKQAKVTDLSSQIDNIEQLRKSMYNSTEDMKAYKDAMNNMASEYPQLISSYDEAGNAIIDLNKAESLLTQARIDSARASYQAAIAEKQEIDFQILAVKELLEKMQAGVPSSGYHVKYQEKVKQWMGPFSWDTTANRDIVYDNAEKAQEKYNKLKINQRGMSDGVVDLDTLTLTFSYDTSEFDKIIKEYPQLFNVSSVPALVGLKETDNWTPEKWEEAISGIQNIYDNLQHTAQAMQHNSSYAKAQDVLFTAVQGLNLNSSEEKSITSLQSPTKLFYNLLNKYAPNSLTIDEWAIQPLSDFNEISAQIATKFVEWYNNLTQKQKTVLESLDYTEYKSVSDIFNVLKIDEQILKNNDPRLYQAFVDQFIESNETERDRILDTIWEKDESGDYIEQKFNSLPGKKYEYTYSSQINSDLTGLLSLSNDQQLEASQIAGMFADSTINGKWGNADIIEKYSDFFTQQLLNINDLAQNGYKNLASARLNVLHEMATQLSDFDYNIQSDLFNIITNIDFGNYDSIISTEESIVQYARNNNLSDDQLSQLLESLHIAENNLIFNVNTLVQTLKDKIGTGAKEVDSILNTNKSGLSFDAALEEFSKLEAKFDNIKSFDEVFIYDAALGKYIYSVNGLDYALTNVQEGINDALKTADNEVKKANEALEKINTFDSQNLIFNSIDFDDMNKRWTRNVETGAYYDFTGQYDEFIKHLSFLYGYENEKDIPEQLKELAKEFINTESDIHTSADFKDFLRERQYFNIDTVTALFDDNQQKEKVEEWYEAFQEDAEYTEKTWDNFLEFITDKVDQDKKDYDIAEKLYKENKNNYKNQLYQSINWSQLSLGTDFIGTNKVSLQLLAEELGMSMDSYWQDILNAYLVQLYATYDEENDKWEFDSEGLAKYNAMKSKIMGEIVTSQSQQVTTAINEILSGGGTLLSETTRGLIQQTHDLSLKFDTSGVLITGQEYVESALKVYEQHKNNLQSLAAKNETYTSILKKSFEQSNQIITTLSSGASLDLDTLNSTFTAFGIELSNYYDALNKSWKVANVNGNYINFGYIFKTDVFGKTQIKDWNKFIEAIQTISGYDINQLTNTFEYQNAYSSYVDGMIQLDTQMNDLIKKSYDNAFSSITEWKPVNVAQLEQFAPGYINYLNETGAATIENGKLVVKNATEFARSISTLMIGLSSLDSKELYNQTGWTTADLAKNWKNAQTVITAVQDSWTGISENLSGLTTDNISALVEKGNLKLTNVTDIFDKFGDVYVLSLTKYREQLEIAFGKTEETPLTSYQQKQVDDAVAKAQAAIVNKITGLNWEQVLGGTATEFETTTFVDELIKSLMSLGLTLDEILANNGSINVQNLRSVLQTKIKEGQVDKEVGEAILNNISNTIATVRDTALEEISDGFSLMTEGTTNQAEIQKFVQRYNKILQAGQQIGTVDSLFEYDSILQTWTLTTEALKTYAENQKVVLRNMGMSEEAIAQFINNQTQQLITSQMDITSYLNSNTLRTDSKEALTLVKQIQQWYAFESEEIWKSFGEQATEIFHITQNGKEKPIEQYSDKNKQDIITSYVMRILSMGGEEAVRMLEELKGSENISSDEIQAVYRAQINRLQTAAEQLAEITVGSLITGDLIPLLQSTSNFEITDLGNGTAVVKAVGDMVEAYARLYYQMKNSAEATTQELNSAYAQMLTAQDQSRIDAISALNDAMGMNYEDLGNLIGKYGKDEWSSLEYMMQHSLTAGIESLGNGQVRIRDFEDFSRHMNWQVNGEAYLEAYSSYRDALIELETKTSTNITNEIKNLTEARPGDKINLTYLSKTLSGATRAFLEKHGAIITNSILELDQNADIPAISQKLIEEAARSGEVISSDLAELAEAINSYLQNLANLIKSGITGNLKATEAQQLQEWAATRGIADLNFIQTREGLKLSQQSAIELYNTLKEIDALQASLVFDELNNSLKETNEHYNSITDILSHIKTLNDDIAKLPVDDKRRQKYEQELALAKEILAVRSTSEDDSFNFMSNKIPGGQNNPLNYANNWMKAFTTIRDSFNTKSKGDQAGFIDYQDWYNIANEINNLAALSGPIEIGALKFDGSLESASAAIQAGCNALTAVDSGEMKVNLMDVGINIQSGADLMGKGIDDGIDQVAKSQIKMLDGLIAMMELIVQMEQLGDLDTEGNGIDLSDLFDFTIDPETNKKIINWDKLNDNYLSWVDKIKETMKTNEDLRNAVEKIKIGKFSLAEIFEFGPDNFKGQNEAFGKTYAAVLEAFRQAALSGNYDLDNIYASIESVLKESGLTEDITLDIGDTTLIISGGVMTTIDWSAPDKKEIRDQYAKAHTGTVEQAQEALIGIQKKYAKGEALGDDLKWALQLNGKLKIESDGTYVINGKSYKNADEAKEAMYTEALKDAGFDDKKITAKDGDVSTTYELKGHKIIVKYDEKGIHYSLEGSTKSYSSQEEMLNNLWEQYVAANHLSSFNVEEKNAWIFENFGVRVQVQPNITDEKGNKLNANDPTVREKIKNEISNIMSGEQLELGDDGNLHIDMGGITYTVSGEAVVEADGTTVNKDKVLAELRSILGLDTVLIDNISLGIQQAFTDLPEIKFDADTEAALAKLKELEDKASKITSNINVGDNAIPRTIDYNKAYGKTNPVYQNINTGANNVKTDINKNTTRGSQSSSPNYTKAIGNIGSAMATGTLMGELGPELVVSGGRYFVAGQNGAEFVNLAPDAIVFNHLQTEQLLKNGMSSSRGKAVTSERNAVAYASGNVSGGPAMASAASALAALKELRAMWQSLLNASLSDLAQLAGGGGGGGGGKKNDAGFARDLERWYNLLRQIADLEKQITYQETLRKKLESDRIIDGKAYYQSQKESLKLLDAEMTRQHELIYLQEDYYKRRQEELNDSKLNTIFTFNEDGLLQLREDEAFTFGKGTKYEFTGTGFEAFSEIFKRDEHEVPKYTAEEQYNMAKAFGWGEYMQYDSSGNKIDVSEEGGYANAVKAFSDKFDSTQKEFETLHDELEDTKKELLTKADERNQQLQAIIDNQVSLENRILSAIENMRQKSIDNAKDQKDAIQESAEKFIDGLSNSLDKERNMYETAENDNELQRMKRQLAILQRSGGSASQIRSLQQNIAERERDTYFQAQQDQIDAIKEASDAEIDRLEHEISIMEETLAYQKEHGLLWQDVYQVMAQTPEQIEAFLLENSKDLEGKSTLQIAEDLRTIKSEIEQWVSRRDDTEDVIAAEPEHNWDVYYPAAKNNFNLDDEVDAALIAKAKQAYEERYAQTGDEVEAAAAADAVFEPYKKAKNPKYAGVASGSEVDNNNVSKTSNQPVTQSKGNGLGKVVLHRKDMNGKTIASDITFEAKAGIPVDFFTLASSSTPAGYALSHATPADTKKVINGGTLTGTGYYTVSVTKKTQEAKLALINPTIQPNSLVSKATNKLIKPLAGFDSGGLANYTGLAMVHGSKQDPEAFLNAEETHMWRDKILSGNSGSLTSMLLDFQNMVSGMVNSESYSSIGTSEGINIENAVVNMNATISNDYDARRAADNVLDEMVRIARKTTAQQARR